MGQTQLDGSGANWKRMAVQIQGARVRAGVREIAPMVEGRVRGNHPHPEEVEVMGMSLGAPWVGMDVEIGGS